MAERPIVFARDGRFEIVSHESAPAEYTEETHAMIQICVPMVGARYTVTRESETGGLVVQDLTARDVLLVPTGQPHAVTWQRRAGIVSLQISQRFVEESLDEALLPLPDAFTVRDRFVTTAAAELYASMLAGEPVSPVFAEALAVGIAHRVTTVAARRPARSRPLRRLTSRQLQRVERFVEDNLERHIGLEELAGITGLSRWYFLRLFRETVGTSPHDYVTRLRLERATGLLRTTDRSVMEIAADVGMTHSHFSRLFARRIGVTPTEFRRDGRYREDDRS
jgi:AraC family transcriptional regulator